MSQLVLVDVTDGVMTVTLNRPERKNALSNEAYGGLADAIERAEKDDGVRVVLLQSEGDVFCAGADIGDFAAANKGGAPRGPRNSTRWIGGLGRIEKPVIVAVQGAAVGIGTTMLMHCDLICMAEEASLRTPFVNLALVPEASSSYLIPKRIGWSRAYRCSRSASRSRRRPASNGASPMSACRAQNCARPRLRWRRSSPTSRSARCARPSG